VCTRGGEIIPGEIMDIALMAEKLESAGEAGQEITSLVRLIARAKTGDAMAFDQIVISCQHRVIALAWRMLGNQDDARDATQECFLRVYKHLDKFDPKQDFSGWLYRIAVNVCRDIARNRHRRNQTSLEAEVEAGRLSEPVSADNTEAAAMLSQEQSLIERALATLTEKERAAIVLRDLEGLPTDEVARILGSSSTTVRSQISSARTKIRAFREKWLKNRGPR
jgi:RNA polymerase sigma-70 factor (ECF subfamily)